MGNGDNGGNAGGGGGGGGVGGKGGIVGNGDNGGRVGGAGGVGVGGSGGIVGRAGGGGGGLGVWANTAVARAATNNAKAPVSLIFISAHFEYRSAASREVLRLLVELQAVVARRVDEGAGLTLPIERRKVLCPSIWNERPKKRKHQKTTSKKRL